MVGSIGPKRVASGRSTKGCGIVGAMLVVSINILGDGFTVAKAVELGNVIDSGGSGDASRDASADALASLAAILEAMRERELENATASAAKLDESKDLLRRSIEKMSSIQVEKRLINVALLNDQEFSLVRSISEELGYREPNELSVGELYSVFIAKGEQLLSVLESLNLDDRSMLSQVRVFIEEFFIWGDIVTKSSIRKR